MPAAQTVATTGALFTSEAPSSPGNMKLRQHVDARMAALVNERLSFWAHWQELAKYLLPRRYKWLITANQGNRGSPINTAIIDNTGTIALRVLAAGMMAGITSPGRPWFVLTLDDPELAESPAVKAWLEEAVRRMRTVLAESNFYTSLGTMYQDLGAFGTAAMVIYEDREDVIRCHNSALGEYCLANSPRMSVNTFYRQFVLTCAQVAREFGVENTGPVVQQAVREKGAMLSKELVIAHAIEPNDEAIEGAAGIRGMPYRECYWEWGADQNTMLRVRGFHECPVIAPRWDIVGNDAYGRSPGMDALGDIKQLQVEQKRKAQAIDKGVNPPMVADTALKNEPASLLPGGVTYVQNPNGVGFKPAYEMKLDLGDLKDDIAEVQSRVRSTFFYDLFLMISQLDTVRSATEIDERREEKLIQLGPVLERFENEALDTSLERVFNIMFRARLLPQLPPELVNVHIKIEYVSMLARAQKAAMTTGLERFVGFIGSLGGAQSGALDNLDIDETAQQYADAIGVSPKCVRSFAKVLKLREARAQAEQAAQAAAAAGQAIEAAKVMSETEVGGGQNALSMAIG